jgi:hypothetical protein
VIDRIVRAIRLDWTVFREIAQDREAMKEAAIIVLVVTFLAALGGTGGMLIAKVDAGTAFLGFFVNWFVNGILIGWIGWAILTYLVGAVLFKGQTDIQEMMRVLGYASAPRLLGLLGFIPCVGWLFVIAGWVLSLIAGIIAIREAMDFDTGNAVITVVISWIAAFVLALLINGIFGMGLALTSGFFG